MTPDVLTDVPGKVGRFWGDRTTFVGPEKPPAWLVRRVGVGTAYNLAGCVAALRLFARRGRCQGVVTQGGASGMFFAWLQALCPWGRKPHVMIDCNWYRSASRLRDRLKALQLRTAVRAVDHVVVWASHEVDDYADAFGLPRQKLEYVPFHTTLHDYQYEVRDDGYLFAGGNYDRDYQTLVDAVRPLDAPTWIATTRPEQLAGVELPPHVRVEGTTEAGFRRAMAAARLVVVPMAGELLHSGGQQTCLNAMLLGKPTVAVGRKWAVDFIDDGVDGLIVDYADPEGLRWAIRRILDDPENARRMGERARARAAGFTTQRCMETVYDLVKRAAADKACRAATPLNAAPRSRVGLIPEMRPIIYDQETHAMIWMLGGYMWLFVHRPFEVWPWLGDLQIERAYMVLMVVFWAVQPNKGWFTNRLHGALVFFTVVLTAAWIASPFMGEKGCMDAVENYYKVIVFYILVVTSVRDEAGLRRLLMLFLAAAGLYMAHSLWEYHNGRLMWRMGISRMIGVDNSFNDPNAFASTLVLALAMTLPFWGAKPSFWMRTLLLGYTGVAGLCILLTGSRTGFMALGLCALLGLSATGRVKTAVLLVVLGVAAAPLAFVALPAELQDRYLTIIDPSYGPQNAEQSAEGRVDGLVKGYEAWTRSPLLGHGPGSFQAATNSDIQAHNVYGQVISELGALGAAALMGLVACYLMNWWEARRFYRENPDRPPTFAFHVARAVALAAVLLLFLGIAGHNLLRYQWVWFAAFQAIALHCIRVRQAAATEAWAPEGLAPSLVS